MYLSHSDCIDLYPSNTHADFTVQLPKTLELQGDWDVGLWSLKISVKHESSEWPELYVCCDGVVMTYVNGRSMRLLRRLTVPQKYQEISFRPVQYFMYDNSYRRDTIHLGILPVNALGSGSLQIQQAECTLHFKKRNST